MKIPATGYKDPETGVTITESDAAKNIEKMEEMYANKIYQVQKNEVKMERAAFLDGKGKNYELKRWFLSAKTFSNGLYLWEKSFSVRPS